MTLLDSELQARIDREAFDAVAKAWAGRRDRAVATERELFRSVVVGELADAHGHARKHLERVLAWVENRRLS